MKNSPVIVSTTTRQPIIPLAGTGLGASGAPILAGVVAIKNPNTRQTINVTRKVR